MGPFTESNSQLVCTTNIDFDHWNFCHSDCMAQSASQVSLTPLQEDLIWDYAGCRLQKYPHSKPYPYLTADHKINQ